MPSIGGNFFVGVPFPVVIGDRFIHIGTDALSQAPVVDVYRWDRDRGLLVAELLLGRPVAGASPITVLPYLGTGGVRLTIDPTHGDLIGYATGGADPRTVIAKRDGIEVRRGDDVLVEMSDSSFAGCPIGVLLDEHGISFGAALPEGFPSRRLIEDATVVLADLVTTARPLVENTDFDRCRILGPAVVVVLDDDTHIENSSFAPGSPNLVLPIPDLGAPIVGAVGLRACRVHDCALEGIALGVPQDQRERILRDLGAPDSS